MGFLGSSAGKQSAWSVGDLGSFPRLARSPRWGSGYPLQYSGLENFMDRGVWQATVHGFAKSWTRLSDFHFHFSTLCQNSKFVPFGHHLYCLPPSPTAPDCASGIQCFAFLFFKSLQVNEIIQCLSLSLSLTYFT